MNDTTSPSPFLRRFGEYLGERFPPVNALAAGVLAASLVSAHAGAIKSLPPLDFSGLAAIILIITMFFILRVCDEYKDADDDAKYRPARPVPRGLISLSELRNAAVAAGVLQALVLLVVAPGLWVLLVATWGWIVLMTLDTPMASMAMKGITIMCGIVMEIGRKIWDREIEGVETYSRVWGRDVATANWFICIGALAALVSLFQFLFVVHLVGGLAAGLIGLATIWVMSGRKAPVGARIELISTVLVLSCQIVLGASPWLP